MTSLILHGVVLACVVCLGFRYSVSAIPVFRAGEFSLDLAPSLPATPAVTVASRPPPAPDPSDIEEEQDEPKETVESPEPGEEIEDLQLLADAPRLPVPVSAPVPANPPSVDPVDPSSRIQPAAGPVSGATSPGLAGAPRLASTIHPIYPPGARLRGEEGKVTVRAAVTASGKAQTAEVVRSSGYPALDQAALNAVRRARFIPARNGWMPIESQTTLTFRFTLVD